MNNHRLPGTLAVREYEIVLSSGTTAALGLALADPACDFWPKKMVRRHRAPFAFGLAALTGVLGGSEEPLFWMVDRKGLALIVDRGSPRPDAHMVDVLAYGLAMLLNDVEGGGANLAAARIAARQWRQRRLH